MHVFFPFILDIKFVGRTSRGHTGERSQGFSIHFPSAVRALIFLARRIPPFLSLIDREVEFCVLTILIVLHSLGIFIFYYFIVIFFSEKNPFYRDRTHVPTCQKVTRLSLSYQGDRLQFNKYIYTHTHEWHRMTRMTRPDCAVMCNLINTHTHTHIHTHGRGGDGGGDGGGDP